MDQHNPYAPSAASLAGAAVTPTEVGGTWRDGAVLVLSRDASLPSRCIKCNEPAAEPTKARKVYWHSSWIYLLVLLNILIYALVAIIVRKKAVVAPGLCSVHKRHRRVGIAVAWTVLLAGLALLCIGVSKGDSAGVGGGIILMLVSALVGVLVSRILRANRIDAKYVRLKGCGSAFLDSMPPFPG
jgi:hypothetical protein